MDCFGSITAASLRASCVGVSHHKALADRQPLCDWIHFACYQVSQHKVLQNCTSRALASLYLRSLLGLWLRCYGHCGKKYRPSSQTQVPLSF